MNGTNDRFKDRQLHTEGCPQIKKVIKEQSKDFDGRFSDAKIMKEYLPTVARGTYYK